MIKKILCAVVILFATHSFAQDKKNEVKLNILNTIINASVELGYERFIDTNQSIDAEFHINDRFFYLGASKRFKTNSFKVGYNFYFEEEGTTGLYVNPFLKYRFGNYEEKDDTKTSLSSFIMGIGCGYMWNYNDTFIIAPYVNIARNFSGTVNSRFWAVEPNLGIRIGYRF